MNNKNTYNLSDNVNDSFEFDLRGNKYVMRYPITEEVEQVQDLNKELAQAERDKDEEQIAAINEKLTRFIYQFITPAGHQLSIEEALKKENIKVMRNFNLMIRKELSVS